MRIGRKHVNDTIQEELLCNVARPLAEETGEAPRRELKQDPALAERVDQPRILQDSRIPLWMRKERPETGGHDVEKRLIGENGPSDEGQFDKRGARTGECDRIAGLELPRGVRRQPNLEPRAEGDAKVVGNRRKPRAFVRHAFGVLGFEWFLEMRGSDQVRKAE
jgi:hypothetical protein